MLLLGGYRLVDTRNLTLFTEEFAASQDSRLLESGFGGDLSEASTVTVSGTTNALLAYVWLVGDDCDTFAGADVLAALPQPATTSRVTALSEAATAIRWRVIDAAGLK
jgi:hypothetical protein